MLALTRKSGEKVLIGEDIIVTVIAISGNRVKIGVEAPSEVPIHREELRTAIKTQGRNHDRRTNGNSSGAERKHATETTV